MTGVMRWSLRLRMGLFFLALYLSSLAVLSLGLLLAFEMLGQSSAQALMLVALIALFGSGFATLGIWWLFDTHVARPLLRLSTALRARAAGGSGALDLDGLRYLGDLGQAAEVLSGTLSSAHVTAAEQLARATQQLAQDRSRLAGILSDLPMAVMMLDRAGSISMYDTQCQHALGGQQPLVLGRDARRYFAGQTLSQALAALQQRDDDEPLCVSLTLADRALQLNATLRRLGDDSGFLLTFDVDRGGLPARPLAFDFARLARPAHPDLAQRPLSELNYVVLDTETTGLDPQRDQVIQIGALRMRGTQIIEAEQFDCFVHPQRPIPAASTRIHGIRDADVADAEGFAEVARRFCHFAEEAVLVAHNAPFDLAFFDREAEQIGMRLDAPVLDTVLLSAALFGRDEAHSLDALAERFGVVIPPELRHRALGDARATAEVFAHMLRFAQARGIVTLGDALSAMRQHARLLPEVLNRPANQRCGADSVS